MAGLLRGGGAKRRERMITRGGTRCLLCIYMAAIDRSLSDCRYDLGGAAIA